MKNLINKYIYCCCNINEFLNIGIYIIICRFIDINKEKFKLLNNNIYGF